MARLDRASADPRNVPRETYLILSHSSLYNRSRSAFSNVTPTSKSNGRVLNVVTRARLLLHNTFQHRGKGYGILAHAAPLEQAGPATGIGGGVLSFLAASGMSVVGIVWFLPRRMTASSGRVRH